MEYCYAVLNDELKHYGIKGMHWGIRRYQPYTSNPRKNGVTGVYKPTTIDGKKGKAELWKARESDRQANRYDRKAKVIESFIQKKQKKLKEAKKEGASDRKIAKLEKRIDYGETQKRINDKLKKAELKNIAKMSIDDVSKARLKKGAHYTVQVLKSTAVKAVTSAALAGAISAFVQSGQEASVAKEAMRNANGAFMTAQEHKHAANEALSFATEISTHNQNYINGMKNGGFKTIRGMTSGDWLDNMHKHNTLAKLAEMDNVRLHTVAHKAAMVSDAMSKIGFGLSATTAGAAAINFTRLGRINEYSTLSGKQRRTITRQEKSGYKARNIKRQDALERKRVAAKIKKLQNKTK